jgi:hypothetical protein
VAADEQGFLTLLLALDLPLAIVVLNYCGDQVVPLIKRLKAELPIAKLLSNQRILCATPLELLRGCLVLADTRARELGSGQQWFILPTVAPSFFWGRRPVDPARVDIIYESEPFVPMHDAVRPGFWGKCS